MSPEENSKKIITSFFDTASHDLFYENMERAKKFSLFHCDSTIESLNEYSESLSEFKKFSEGEALVLEKKIKFWIQTKEEIKKN
jgi:hypothetical protein